MILAKLLVALSLVRSLVMIWAKPLAALWAKPFAARRSRSSAGSLSVVRTVRKRS